MLPELLKHRKREHKDLIAPCRNILKGACKFGKSKCWFNHDNIENSNESEVTENLNKENNDVIQKLFKMMETMTHCTLYRWRKVILKNQRTKQSNE